MSDIIAESISGYHNVPNYDGNYVIDVLFDNTLKSKIEAFENTIKTYLGDTDKEIVIMSPRKQALHYALKTVK